MTTDGEHWHIVEAKRDDGMPTMFRIRELDPRKQLTKIFVVELAYPTTELSRLPGAADYRRLAELEDRWLRPACTTLGWEVVGHKIEDGSFFLYMYGASDPALMIEKLSPFDAGLAFYDDDDPDWQEYGTLRELLDQAKAIPAAKPASKPKVKTKSRPPAKPRAAASARAKAKPISKPKTKPARRSATRRSATR